MRRPEPTSASSGWGWNAQGVPGVPPRARAHVRRGTGTLGVVLAAFLFVGVLGAAGATVYAMSGSEDAPLVAAQEESSEESTEPASESEPAPTEVAKDSAVAPNAPPPSLEKIVWTTEAASTLKDLSVAWSIPRDRLAELNPELAAEGSIKAGTKVVVYTPAIGPSVSVGPPNNGKLTRGVPLPEGDAWLPPEDRTRAFATSETIAAVTAALQAYGREFPDAEPIQVGDLSARRGGEIYGHQSHQSGRDVDIRLIRSDDGEGVDAQRNWFLVKTVIDGADVRAIFLNRTEQAWLREAAEADVGATKAADYFELIRHEPGHTIHMHIRYACEKGNSRCVAYTQPDTDEQDPKPGTKLPGLKPGAKPGRGGKKLPGGSKGRLPAAGKKKKKKRKNKRGKRKKKR